MSKAKLKILLSCFIIGIAVALTYYAFEFAVHHSINYLWNDLFDSETKRYMVMPAVIIFGLIFFILKHKLLPKESEKSSHGLGEGSVDLSLRNFFIILIVGFFSLIAGASLGPEAILVPACLVAGGLIGKKFISSEKESGKIVSAAAIIALFASFFHSFIVGLLCIFLVKKVAGAKITPALVIIGIIASGAATVTLNFIEPESANYFRLPGNSLELKLEDSILAVLLVIGGFISTMALRQIYNALDKVKQSLVGESVVKVALIASTGLGFIYLLGGPLVQFTGNESIKPLLEQAPALGIAGLIWIWITKLLAIGWSKSLGYQGGLIFPMIFVGSTLVAIALQYSPSANFIVLLIATVIGILVADKKAKILL
jgi:H+/Cl- antiporter ClcA